MSYTKGYKAFNKTGKEGQGECRGFLFKEGESYKIDGKLKLCSNGFHFCRDLVLTFEYYGYDIEKYCFAEVEAIGDIDYETPTKHKAATSEIRIIKFLSHGEFLSIIKGDSNSGNWNSGNSNSGHSNSGNSNSGYDNSGDFNTTTPQYKNVFNKPCLTSVWEVSCKPDFLYFELIEGKTYKESFIESFNKSNKKDVKLLLLLPNFNYTVFEEISGITKEMIDNKLKD